MSLVHELLDCKSYGAISYRCARWARPLSKPTEETLLVKRITIERYESPEDSGFAGTVEGTRKDGSSWTIWLDQNDSPCGYVGERHPETGERYVPVEEARHFVAKECGVPATSVVVGQEVPELDKNWEQVLP
jgi:hypothetical protein